MSGQGHPAGMTSRDVLLVSPAAAQGPPWRHQQEEAAGGALGAVHGVGRGGERWRW
jgi:hypothetical protein